MGSRRIAVTIRADGTIEAETLGITGDACLEYLPLLENLLDAEVVGSSFTSDYDEGRSQSDAVAEAGSAATETVREQESS